MAETIIVAQDGTGDYSDIQAALNAAEPGDTVYIRAGSYETAEGFELNTPNVTVAGYPGDALPQIVASNGADGPHAVFTFGIDADGSTLRGLDISGGREYVVKLETALEYDDRSFGQVGQAASNITIENNKLHDSGRDVIKITPNCDGVQILNNEIYDSGRAGTSDDHPAANAEGIDVVNGDNITIRGNYIHDTATTGAYVKGGSIGAVIEDNLIENTGISTADIPNSGAGISLGYETDAEFYDADNTGFVGAFDAVVRNNVVRNTMDTGIQMVGAVNPVIESNTIIDAGGVDAGSTRWYLGGISAYQLTTYTGATDTVVAQTENPTIVNNIVIASQATSDEEVWATNDPLFLSGGTVLDNAQIEGNIYWDRDGTTSFGGRSFEDYQQETGFDSNGQVYDPTDMLDETGAPVAGSLLAQSGAGAVVADHYGYSAGYAASPEADTTAPDAPVITHADDYDTEYYHGKLIYWDGVEGATYYNVYIDGQFVGYTTATGYYSTQQGTYDITVEAVDQAGNVSAQSESFEFTYGDPNAAPPTDNPPADDPGDGDTPTEETPVQTYPGDEELTPVDGVEGISGVYLSPGTDGEDRLLVIQFTGSSYFGYTDGVISLVDTTTGEIAFSVNPELGDSQEGQGYFIADIPVDLADGTYRLEIGYQFARLELPNGDWITTGSLSGDGWSFTIGDGYAEPPTETPPVDGDPGDGSADDPLDGFPEGTTYTAIEGAAGVAGFYSVPADSETPARVIVQFEGNSYFGYTDGVLQIVDSGTGEVVLTAEPDRGDSQEWSDRYEVSLPDGVASGDVQVSLGYQFARIELPDGTWVTTGEVEVQSSASPGEGGEPTAGEAGDFIAIDGVAGISGIEIVEPSADGDGSLTVHFEGQTYFGDTGGVLEIRDAETGELVLAVDPDLGDTQQGASSFEINLPAEMAGGSYIVSVGYQFARMALPDGSWISSGAVDEEISLSFGANIDGKAMDGPAAMEQAAVLTEWESWTLLDQPAPSDWDL